MVTLKQIFNDNFESYGATLDEKRREIRFKGIQFLTRTEGYTIAIPCSKIISQDVLDDINDKYGVTVHYGTAKHYQLTDLNLSRCNKVNNSKDPTANKCYLSCDNLLLEDAIELYKRLINDNL